MSFVAPYDRDDALLGGDQFADASDLASDFSYHDNSFEPRHPRNAFDHNPRLFDSDPDQLDLDEPDSSRFYDRGQEFDDDDDEDGWDVTRSLDGAGGPGQQLAMVHVPRDAHQLVHAGRNDDRLALDRVSSDPYDCAFRRVRSPRGLDARYDDADEDDWGDDEGNSLLLGPTSAYSRPDAERRRSSLDSMSDDFDMRGAGWDSHLARGVGEAFHFDDTESEFDDLRSFDAGYGGPDRNRGRRYGPSRHDGGRRHSTHGSDFLPDLPEDEGYGGMDMRPRRGGRFGLSPEPLTAFDDAHIHSDRDGQREPRDFEVLERNPASDCDSVLRTALDASRDHLDAASSRGSWLGDDRANGRHLEQELLIRSPSMSSIDSLNGRSYEVARLEAQARRIDRSRTPLSDAAGRQGSQYGGFDRGSDRLSLASRMDERPVSGVHAGRYSHPRYSPGRRSSASFSDQSSSPLFRPPSVDSPRGDGYHDDSYEAPLEPLSSRSPYERRPSLDHRTSSDSFHTASMFTKRPSEEDLHAALGRIARPRTPSRPDASSIMTNTPRIFDEDFDAEGGGDPAPRLRRLHYLQDQLTKLRSAYPTPRQEELVFSEMPTDRSRVYEPGRLSDSDTKTKQFVRHEHRLQNLLDQVDVVQPAGSADVRRARRSLVDAVQARLAHLDDARDEAWRRQMERAGFAAAARRAYAEDEIRSIRHQRATARMRSRSPLSSPAPSFRNSFSGSSRLPPRSPGLPFRSPLVNAQPLSRPPLAPLTSGPSRLPSFHTGRGARRHVSGPAPFATPLVSPPRAPSRASALGMGRPTSAAHMRTVSSPSNSINRLGRAEAQLQAGRALSNKTDLAAQRRGLQAQLHGTQQNLRAQAMTSRADLASRRRDLESQLHATQRNLDTHRRMEADQTLANKAEIAAKRRHLEAQLRQMELDIAEHAAEERLHEKEARLREMQRMHQHAELEERAQAAADIQENLQMQGEIRQLRQEKRDLERLRMQRRQSHLHHRRMQHARDAQRNMYEQLTAIHALRRYPLPFESTSRLSQMHRDPFRYDPQVNFGYGRLQPLSTYGMDPRRMSTLDAQALDDLYLYESQLRLDRTLREEDRRRLWHDRMRWEELDRHEQRMRWMEMNAARRRSLGLGEGGFWSSHFNGDPLSENLGYTRRLDPAATLQPGSFRRGVAHYPLSNTLQRRYPVWKSGGVGIGSRISRWLSDPGSYQGDARHQGMMRDLARRRGQTPATPRQGDMGLRTPRSPGLSRTPRSAGFRTPRPHSPGHTPFPQAFTPAPPPPPLPVQGGALMAPMPQRPITPTRQRPITPTRQRAMSPAHQRAMSPAHQRAVSPGRANMMGRPVSPASSLKRGTSPAGTKPGLATGAAARRPSTSSAGSDITTTDGSSPGTPASTRPRRRSVTFNEKPQDLEQLRPKSPGGPRSALRSPAPERRSATMEDLDESELSEKPSRTQSPAVSTTSRSTSDPPAYAPTQSSAASTTQARPPLGPRTVSSPAGTASATAASPAMSALSGSSSSKSSGGASAASGPPHPKIARQTIIRAAQQARAKASQETGIAEAGASGAAKQGPPENGKA